MVSQSPLRVPYAMRNAGPSTGVADVLAGKASAQNVYRIDLAPVDAADVTEVRDVRMMCSQQGTYMPVVVGDPHESGFEYFLHGRVQAAVASAE